MRVTFIAGGVRTIKTVGGHAGFSTDGLMLFRPEPGVVGEN
jgi:hypothetical protein